MKRSRRQCQAVTLASSYSSSHRCLKRNNVHKAGAAYLCSHHRAMISRNRA